jgi:threonine aldolase
VSQTKRVRQFASDNYAGICPTALEAMSAANAGHVFSYGRDDWTLRAANKLREFFEINCEVFFVFNGTAANSLALASLCQSYHSVICAETSHIETDECGAPEFFSNGTKVLLGKGKNGKVTPKSVEELVLKRTDIHYPKPKVISVTQATEVGTVYSEQELDNLSHMAKKHRLKLHMDGARFGNALASLNVAPKEITWQVGIDVLCLGGTKNGMAVGEAVIFFDRDLANEFAYRCKQGGQLASKMRYLAAPWVTMLDDAYLRNAAHANSMATRLEKGLRKIATVEIMFPRQANSVFVTLPPDVKERLHEIGWHFYGFIGVGGSRLMCSWDTTTDDVDAILADIKRVVASLTAPSKASSLIKRVARGTT